MEKKFLFYFQVYFSLVIKKSNHLCELWDTDRSRANSHKPESIDGPSWLGGLIASVSVALPTFESRSTRSHGEQQVCAAMVGSAFRRGADSRGGNCPRRYNHLTSVRNVSHAAQFDCSLIWQVGLCGNSLVLIFSFFFKIRHESRVPSDGKLTVWNLRASQIVEPASKKCVVWLFRQFLTAFLIKALRRDDKSRKLFFLFTLYKYG